MKVKKVNYEANGIPIIIRSAETRDANQLSQIRVQIDGETEFLDREPGEAFLDSEAFKELISSDQNNKNHLFLVAEANGKIIGFSRCEGSNLKRMSHKVEFGICILKEYWSLGIGKQLIETSIHWASENNIKKIVLSVIEINEKAMEWYKRYGFEVEGVLKKDKRLEDGVYYSTIIMGKFLE